MPKTAAEKQKAYRERLKVMELQSNPPVTLDGNGNATEKVTRVTIEDEQCVTVCQTCGGPVQLSITAKCLKCCTGMPAPKAERSSADRLKEGIEACRLAGVSTEIESGPLSVYGPERWARLQEEGYVWQGTIAIRYPDIMAVPVPGDPAYQGAGSCPRCEHALESGSCEHCGYLADVSQGVA